MTPTIEVASTAVQGQELASQNLFEHIAQQAQGMSQGASPTQLGDGMLSNLDGYLARAKQFSQRANDMGSTPSPMAPQATGHTTPKEGTPRLQETQLEQVVGSLSMMFDHAIETQMVVRGATQVSGAANTLLRGQ
jgi:hypothetical protein